ncbi:hypothetical protein D3C87_1879530 [compost metagenome]
MQAFYKALVISILKPYTVIYTSIVHKAVNTAKLFNDLFNGLCHIGRLVQLCYNLEHLSAPGNNIVNYL